MFDPKQLRRKGKERHIFLFEQALLFSKETKDADGKIKYLFKNKIKVNTLTYSLYGRVNERDVDSRSRGLVRSKTLNSYSSYRASCV